MCQITNTRLILKMRFCGNAPYLKKEWCEFVVENPICVEVQDDNRVKFWARISEFGNRALRVVTLDDRITIHNAFPDSNFKE